MNNLTNEEYFEFQDFLTSDKDELQYFNIKAKDNNVITFEEHIQALKKIRNKLVKEAEPLVKKIVERNPWIKTTLFSCDGPIIFNEGVVNNIVLTNRLSISQNENKIKTIEIFNFLGYPPFFLGVYYDVISSSIWALLKTKQLEKNSHKEIMEIFSLIKEYFQPQYSSSYSVSNKFKLENNSNVSSVYLVGDSKKKDVLFWANLTNEEINYIAPVFTDNKIKIYYLNEENRKILSKKIYIAKKR